MKVRMKMKKIEIELYHIINKWKKDNKKNNLMYFFIVIMVVFGLIFILNHYTVFTADDHHYHYIFDSYLPTEYSKRIESIGDIVNSMISHYQIWGGRIVAHFFVQLFTLFPKIVFQFINSVIFVLLGYLVIIHAIGKKLVRPSIGIFTYSFLFLFLPYFGQTVLWLSGSCNYLWCSCLILIALLPFRYVNEQVKWYHYFSPFISLLAGWTNENTGMAMVICMLLFVINISLKKKKVQRWMWISMLFGFIGSILCIAAPGNGIRSQGYPPLTVNRLFENFVSIIKFFMENSLIVIAIIIILYGIYLLSIKNPKEIRILLTPTIYIICSIISVGAIILSPLASPRSYFLAIVFMLIAILYLFQRISLYNIVYKKIFFLITIIMLSYAGYQYFYAAMDIRKTYFEVQVEVSMIKQQKKEGKKIIYINRHHDSTNQYNAITNTANLTHNSEDWFTAWYAKYYNVDKIDY